MMKKRFAVAFVATTTFLAAASGSAFALGTHRNQQPPVPEKPAAWIGESGTASYYGPRYHGHRSASGARFDQTALTAAHPWLPFGTKVKVTLAGTGRTVIVTITDRLYSSRRVVDLSLAAARQLGMIRRGVATVTLLPV
jgi:rare lipoprotein A